MKQCKQKCQEKKKTHKSSDNSEERITGWQKKACTNHLLFINYSLLEIYVTK